MDNSIEARDTTFSGVRRRSHSSVHQTESPRNLTALRQKSTEPKRRARTHVETNVASQLSRYMFIKGGYSSVKSLIDLNPEYTTKNLPQLQTNTDV